jgi:hypothetical protein
VPIIKILIPRHRDDFCNIFRTVAANPVGRVLLYRLLIEVRSTDNDGMDVAKMELTLGGIG